MPRSDALLPQAAPDPPRPFDDLTVGRWRFAVTLRRGPLTRLEVLPTVRALGA